MASFLRVPPINKKRKRGGWPYLAQGYQIDQAKRPWGKQNNSACLVQCHQEMRRVPRNKERLTLPKSKTNSITGTTMTDKEMVLPRSCLSGKGTGRETWQCVRSCLRHAPCFYLSQLLTAGALAGPCCHWLWLNSEASPQAGVCLTLEWALGLCSITEPRIRQHTP